MDIGVILPILETVPELPHPHCIIFRHLIREYRVSLQFVFWAILSPNPQVL